jgi:hypothetical protein
MFGPPDTYHYVPDDTTYALLFGGIVSINHRNLIKVVRAAFEKIAIWKGGSSEGPLFLGTKTFAFTEH